MRALFRAKPGMRDRHADRQAGTDPKFGVETPSGDLGPSGAALGAAQEQGGAMEPDAPRDETERQ